MRKIVLISVYAALPQAWLKPLLLHASNHVALEISLDPSCT
jgi:hypothetical protein